MPKFPKFDIADLRRKVTIQKRIRVSDGAGGDTAWTYQDVVTTWVAFAAWKGWEHQLQQSIASNQLFEVDMRYRPGITPDMVVYDAASGNRYNIRFVVDPDLHRIMLHLSVELIRQNE